MDIHIVLDCAVQLALSCSPPSWDHYVCFRLNLSYYISCFQLSPAAPEGYIGGGWMIFSIFFLLRFSSCSIHCVTCWWTVIPRIMSQENQEKNAFCHWISPQPSFWTLKRPFSWRMCCRNWGSGMRLIFATLRPFLRLAKEKGVGRMRQHFSDIPLSAANVGQWESRSVSRWTRGETGPVFVPIIRTQSRVGMKNH